MHTTTDTNDMTATAPTPTTKLSSADLLERLDHLARIQNLQLRPGPLLVYKPNREAKGNALKLELRLQPQFSEEGYQRKPAGGLFLDLVAQTGVDQNKNATFGWGDDAGKLTAKLGLPDMSRMLLGYTLFRERGQAIPPAYRPKRDEQGIAVEMFHKFGETSTVITWAFLADGSTLRVSKGPQQYRSIKLDLAEELLLVNYLKLALTGFQLAGLR
jgi:hypothetical protein